MSSLFGNLNKKVRDNATDIIDLVDFTIKKGSQHVYALNVKYEMLSAALNKISTLLLEKQSVTSSVIDSLNKGIEIVKQLVPQVNVSSPHGNDVIISQL